MVRGRRAQGLLVIVLAVIIYLALSMMTVLFIRSVFLQVEAQSLHRVERAFFAVMQYYLNKVELPQAFEGVAAAYLLDEDENLVFSLYQEESEDIAARVKSLLPTHQAWNWCPDFTRQTLIILRRLDQPQAEDKLKVQSGLPTTIFGFDKQKRRNLFIPPDKDRLFFMERPFLKYIYLEIEATAYLFFMRFYYPLQIVALLLLLLFMAFVVLVFLKNIRYRQQLQMQNDFVVLGKAASTLAHEMKNPLAAILIQTSLIKLKDIGQNAREEIQIIEEETKRLTELSSTVGQLIRNPLGEPQQVELVKFVAELLARKNKLIQLKTESRFYYILFDPLRLNIVIENIINNALESGSPLDEIVVEIKEERKRVVLNVWDRGEGLKEQAEVLFTPLFTTKPTGSGLGLSVARRYLQAAGASIILKNRPDGKGAVASLRFKKMSGPL